MPRRFLAYSVLSVLFLIGLGCVLIGHPAVRAAGADSDPNAACAPCHREIYDRYRETPMARASGPAAAGFIPADFFHSPSGVHYRVYEDGGRVWLSYERASQGETSAAALDGRRELRYFLGSGLRGRTYLFEQQGYWFEAPINWYAKKHVWDMTPAFLDAREVPLTLPVDPGCLHCHASQVASSLPEARNLYAAAPFAEGGITCAACHGDASAHLASGGKVKLLDIDALPAVRRDSICLNCHVEGQASVHRLGKRPQDFRPGDDLFDYSLFFVYRGEQGSGGRATSQYEALLKSQCWQQSGGRLTCTTCHDPHGGPAPDQRVAWYRRKCLECHDQPAFAAAHHPENPDCTACHMARPPSNDIAHEQVTDHWIKRRISDERLPLATSGDLVTVGGVAAGDRDLGLAYAQMATRGDQHAGQRALELLRRAETESNGATADHELHAQLGFLEQVSGHSEGAAAEYREALAADPYDSLAAGNLALIQAQAHNLADAARLWRDVFAHDPVELGAGFNLAVVECGAGRRAEALNTLDRILEFAPDNHRARQMSGEIVAGTRACGGR